MNEILIITIAAMVCMSAIGTVAYLMVSTQQRTIDRLTDKLMARDYKEYSTMNAGPTEPEKPKRKPTSWYDDPSINIDDDDEDVAN